MKCKEIAIKILKVGFAGDQIQRGKGSAHVFVLHEKEFQVLAMGGELCISHQCRLFYFSKARGRSRFVVGCDPDPNSMPNALSFDTHS
jgi:hypothetical protein